MAVEALQERAPKVDVTIAELKKLSCFIVLMKRV